MFFCQNCNNSLDITKNTNVKKIEKNVINTHEEFIKLYNNKNTQNYYLNFNDNSLKLFLKKEDFSNEDYTNILNSFYTIINNQKDLSPFYLKCVNCNNTNTLQANTILYSISFINTNDSFDMTDEDLIIKCNDPILPRTSDYVCPNTKCKTHNNIDSKEAVFFRNDNSFNLTYICCACYNQWHI
jgi:hypothetical protein